MIAEPPKNETLFLHRQYWVRVRRIDMNRNPLFQYVLAILLSFTLATVNIIPAKAETAQNIIPPFQEFINSVKNGQATVVSGVYVDNILALRVIQQPAGAPAFVSSINNTVTQFGMAADYGTIGLLAHNYLSGSSFFNLVEGQEVKIVYGDGSVERFVITAIYRYQALNPYSTNSDFVDLNTNATISAAEVFAKVYSGERHITLQTCIKMVSEFSWGRLFVIAMPIK